MILFAYLNVYHMCAWCQESECIKSPGTGVIDGCEPPCECWKLNLGLLQEQEMLQTLSHLSSVPLPIFVSKVLLNTPTSTHIHINTQLWTTSPHIYNNSWLWAAKQLNQYSQQNLNYTWPWIKKGGGQEGNGKEREGTREKVGIEGNA